MPSPGKAERLGLIQQIASRLRFPQLFFLVAALFLVDLFLLDPIPLLDEVLLGLATVLLGTWKKGRDPDQERVVKNVTPKSE